MQYKEKDISTFTDDELANASLDIAGMRKKHKDAENDPRFADRFKNQPERNLNPVFLQLEAEIKQELENRKLK